jgi:hypothetical protein
VLVFAVPEPRSATFRALNAGVAADPEMGPPKKVFFVSVAQLPVSVPDPVTGDPETENSPGKESPTEVTDPRPAGKSADTSDLNAGVAEPPLVGPAKTLFADSLAHAPVRVPDDVTGEPDTENSPGRLKPTDVTSTGM